MVPLLALIAVVNQRTAYALRYHIFTEFALLIFCEYILILAFTACGIILAGKAIFNKEIAVLAFVRVDIVILLAGEAYIRTRAGNTVV